MGGGSNLKKIIISANPSANYVGFREFSLSTAAGEFSITIVNSNVVNIKTHSGKQIYADVYASSVYGGSSISYVPTKAFTRYPDRGYYCSAKVSSASDSISWNITFRDALQFSDIPTVLGISLNYGKNFKLVFLDSDENILFDAAPEWTSTSDVGYGKHYDLNLDFN